MELAEEKGVTLEADMNFDYQSFKESQYDKLAQAVRDNLDMDYIYGLLK